MGLALPTAAFADGIVAIQHAASVGDVPKTVWWTCIDQSAVPATYGSTRKQGLPASGFEAGSMFLQFATPGDVWFTTAECFEQAKTGMSNSGEDPETLAIVNN